MKSKTELGHKLKAKRLKSERLKQSFVDKDTLQINQIKGMENATINYTIDKFILYVKKLWQ